MALKEQDIVFTTTDEAGNTVIQFPITRVENVEDAVRTVNKKKPDSNGDIQIDVDMSHLATKDELTKGLANKRDHTIQGSSSKALFNFAPRELLSITQSKFLCKRLFRVLLKSFPRSPTRT